jgi:NhaP-type Na+/H+ or K+/H+ antiporter
MDIYFLIFSLFFPRITLLVYFLQDWYPKNTVPFVADVLLGVFIPRALVLIYIYQNMGYDNIWFAAHLVVMILAYFGGGRETRRRRWRRRRVVVER